MNENGSFGLVYSSAEELRKNNIRSQSDHLDYLQKTPTKNIFKSLIINRKGYFVSNVSFFPLNLINQSKSASKE